MPKDANADLKKAVDLIAKSNKTAFGTGQAKAKEVLKALKKSDSPQEIQEIMKIIEQIKTRMSAEFDSQIRVLKVTLANMPKAS